MTLHAKGWAALASAAALAITGCHRQEPEANQADMNTNLEAPDQLMLSSSVFESGKPIPSIYGCDDKGVSPPLSWSGLPDRTKSIAITIDDPDAKKAPGGVFRHWAIYDIPQSQTELQEGAGSPADKDFKQSLNDGGKPGYTPMCPPRGDPPHHYHFRLFALDVDHLDLPADAKVKDVEDAAKKHSVGETELVGTFQRT